MSIVGVATHPLPKGGIYPSNEDMVNVGLKTLSYLSIKEIFAYGRVCKACNAGSKNPRLWETFDVQKIFPKVTVLGKEIWPKLPETNELMEASAGDRSLVGMKLVPHSFPHSLTLIFLSYLEPSDLMKVAKFKGWRIFCDYVMYSFLNNPALDKPFNGHEIREMIPPIQKLLPHVEEDLGVTVVTMPQGLAFNHLVYYAESLIDKYGIIFRDISKEFQEEFGNKILDATYRVVVTNGVIKGTRGYSFEFQKAFVARIVAGCDAPKVIEMTTHIMGMFTTLNRCLFVEGTYTKCREISVGFECSVAHRAETMAGGFIEESGFSIEVQRANHELYGLVGRYACKSIDS